MIKSASRALLHILNMATYSLFQASSKTGDCRIARFIAMPLALLILACAGCGSRGGGAQAQPNSKDSLRIAVEFNSHSACAHIAKAKGWFDEEGLEINSFDCFATGMAQSAGLARGDIDAAYICLLPAINAYSNAKVQIKIVANLHDYGYSLVADPKKVASVADLGNPGVTLGCPREGSPNDALMNLTIEKHGLDKETILGKTRRMSPPRLFLALTSGSLDAAWLPEQYPSMAQAAGFKRLLSASDLWPGMPGSVLVVRRDLIESRPDAVRKLVRATVRATRFIRDNLEEAGRVVAGSLQASSGKVVGLDLPGSQSPVMADARILSESMANGMTCTNRIDAVRVQEAIDTAVRLGYIQAGFPASEIIHAGFLDEE